MSLGWAGVLVQLTGLVIYLVLSGPCALSVVVGLLAVGGLAARQRVPVSRSILLVIALVMALALLVHRLGLPAGSILVGPSSYSVATFLALMVVVTLYRKCSPEEVTATLASGVVLTMACGMTTRMYPYAVAVAVQAALLAHALCATHHENPRRRVRPWALGLLVPALMLGSVAACILKWSDTKVNALMALFSPAVSVAPRFAPTTTLKGIMSVQGSDAVTLRLFARTPPPYLVGRCYDVYRGHSWEWRASRRTVRPSPVPASRYGLSARSGNLFAARRPQGAVQVDRVELASGFLGATLFAPRDTDFYAARVDRIDAYTDGVFQVPTNEPFDGVYYLVCDRHHRSLDPLTPAQRAAYLELPKHLAPVVSRLAHQVTAGQTHDLARAAALEAYLQTNFRYGFGYPFHKGDPLKQFLTSRPPAHCEFFATAMALMLRTLGIPSRYVVGFKVVEHSAFGDYWVVRARYAHAWVEAYIQGAGWTRFDPTPPGSMPKPGAVDAFYQGCTDWLNYHWLLLQRFLRLNPGRMLEAVLGLITDLATSPVALVWLALAATLGILWRRRALDFRAWLRRLVSGRSRGSGSTPEVSALQILLGEFESLVKAVGMERLPSQTLLEWSAQLQRAQGLQEPEKVLCANFLEAYCQARYGGAEQSQSLEQRLVEFRRMIGERNRGGGRQTVRHG